MIDTKKEEKTKRRTFLGAMWFVFFIGLVFATNIFDINIETVEINATVTKTYSSVSTGMGGNGGPKMNIEWIDLNGETQREGMSNIYNLEVGDSYSILVDAKTHSRHISSKSTIIIFSVIGTLTCVGSGYAIWKEMKNKNNKE